MLKAETALVALSQVTVGLPRKLGDRHPPRALQLVPGLQQVTGLQCITLHTVPPRLSLPAPYSAYTCHLTPTHHIARRPDQRSSTQAP